MSRAAPRRRQGIRDSAALLPGLKAHKVAVVPGAWFHAASLPGPFLRLSFASASDADFDVGLSRLASLLARPAWFAGFMQPHSVRLPL